MKNKVILFFLAVTMFISLNIPEGQVTAAAPTTIQMGSQNGDVWDLQYRLKVLGYYQGQIDGKFSKGTQNAVYKFQKNYGLQADGVVGKKTWSQLKKFTLNQKEMNIMAKVIYSEARGEPYMGQVAVGAVVMKRIRTAGFPNTIEGVVFQSGAFTAVDDGQYWLTPNDTAYKAAQDAVRGWDPSKGAIYYYNPKTATNQWIRTREVIVKIGNHVFAK